MSAEPKSTLVATWLPPDGYALLEKQFMAWGVPIPDPELSSVAIVIDSETNQLAGFLVAQSVVHLEPLFVDPKYRTGEVLRLLVDKAQEPFKEAGSAFYAFSETDKIAHLLESEGMKELSWKVFVKSFEKE